MVKVVLFIISTKSKRRCTAAFTPVVLVCTESQQYCHLHHQCYMEPYQGGGGNQRWNEVFIGPGGSFLLYLMVPKSLWRNNGFGARSVKAATRPPYVIHSKEQAIQVQQTALNKPNTQTSFEKVPKRYESHPKMTFRLSRGSNQLICFLSLSVRLHHFNIIAGFTTKQQWVC